MTEEFAQFIRKVSKLSDGINIVILCSNRELAEEFDTWKRAQGLHVHVHCSHMGLCTFHNIRVIIEFGDWFNSNRHHYHKDWEKMNEVIKNFEIVYDTRKT